VGLLGASDADDEGMDLSRNAARSPLRSMLALLVLCSLVAGCNSSGSRVDGSSREKIVAEKGVSDKAPITITVWDQDVRAAQDAEITKLNEEFEHRYPNVTINRVARSFFDLKSRLQRSVSGGRLPDVVQVNQGWADMGQLVRSGLLRPLDTYTGLYGWEQRYSPALLEFNSFSTDGRRFGEGSLFGLSQEGEMVGVYYNKSKLRALHLELPRTLSDFEHDLKIAKGKGEVPIQFGNLDKFPAIHEFQALQDQFVPAEDLRNLVLGRADLSFDSKGNLSAASRLRAWVQNGYFPQDFDSTGYNDAWERFTRGSGLFLITGTWLARDLDDRMPGNVGFFLMPPFTSHAAPVATGGEGLAFAVTNQSQHPNAAAAYLDFITSPHAGRVIVKAGGLPAMSLPSPTVPRGTSLHDIFDAWATISRKDGLVPYLDYATPTFYGVITSGLQNLMSGLESPRRFLRSLQANYSTFQDLR
jgi:raffinose/stachyose/melibiose transport system substrate-binding protein